MPRKKIKRNLTGLKNQKSAPAAEPESDPPEPSESDDDNFGSSETWDPHAGMGPTLLAFDDSDGSIDEQFGKDYSPSTLPAALAMSLTASTASPYLTTIPTFLPPGTRMISALTHEVLESSEVEAFLAAEQAEVTS